MMKDITVAIKELIIEALNLEELEVKDIETDAALFGDGLGLDSIDALELGLAIKNRFGVLMSSDGEEMRQHFYSVATLASYINAQESAKE